MPAAGAHYQFGQLVQASASPAVTQAISSHQAMFDLGTQGPDILFFYRPYSKNPISRLGHILHSHSGHHLLLPLLPERSDWSPALTAYLLGLCCHYILDSRCHPRINQLAPTTKQHQRIEAALDRLVFDSYHLTAPRHHMAPTKVDIPALQAVYSELTRGQLREAAASLHHYNHLLEHPRLVSTLEGIAGKPGAFSLMCVPPEIAPEDSVHQLLPLFQAAIPQACRLLAILLDTATNDDTLLREMNLNYEGVTP